MKSDKISKIPKNEGTEKMHKLTFLSFKLIYEKKIYIFFKLFFFFL